MTSKPELSTVPPIGTLSVGMQRGKVIAEWQVCNTDSRSLGLPALSDAQRTVKVTLTNEKGLSFTATGPLLPQPMSGSDIEVLRQQVLEELRKQLMLRTALPWEQWLQVEVRSEVEFGPKVTASARVSYTHIWRAIGPDGTVLTVHPTNNVVLPLEPAIDEQDSRLSTLEIGGRRFREDPNLKSRSYVPATPENIAAVEDIQRRLRELNSALGEVLKQSRADETLKSVGKGQKLISLEAPK